MEAIVKEGTVTNIIIGSNGASIPCPDRTQIGWLYDGSNFREPSKSVEERLQDIIAKYEKVSVAGITYNGSTFQSDAASIAALNEVLTAVANGWGLPANFAWIDSENVPHVADLAFLKGLAIALADHKAALFARLQVAKAALRSATTQAEIEAITL